MNICGIFKYLKKFQENIVNIFKMAGNGRKKEYYRKCQTSGNPGLSKVYTHTALSHWNLWNFVLYKNVSRIPTSSNMIKIGILCHISGNTSLKDVCGFCQAPAYKCWVGLELPVVVPLAWWKTYFPWSQLERPITWLPG